MEEQGAGCESEMVRCFSTKKILGSQIEVLIAGMN